MIINSNSSIDKDKEEVIDSLYKVMCTNTTTKSDNKVENNDYFKRRVLGFKAEIEFEEEIKKTDFSFRKGGTFLSPQLDGSKDMKNKFAYITIDSLKAIEYTNIYSEIAAWDEVQILYYAQIKLEEWKKEYYEVKEKQGGRKYKTKILVPEYKLYKFDRVTKRFIDSKDNNFSNIFEISNTKRSRDANTYHLRKRDQFVFFNDYKPEILKKIYADRYFIDKLKNEQDVLFNIIDFDGFITKNERTLIIEIKEKTPIKPEVTKPKEITKDKAKEAVFSKFGCKTDTELRKNKNYTMSVTGEKIPLKTRGDWVNLYKRCIGEPPVIKRWEDEQLWSYGWDTRRLLWYLEVQKEIGLEILYIIRQIETREERKFIQWDSISFKNFLKGVSWSNSRGGGGGEDTLTAPYSHFNHFKNLKEGHL